MPPGVGLACRTSLSHHDLYRLENTRSKTQGASADPELRRGPGCGLADQRAKGESCRHVAAVVSVGAAFEC
jgi:hypothetical protein